MGFDRIIYGSAVEGNWLLYSTAMEQSGLAIIVLCSVCDAFPARGRTGSRLVRIGGGGPSSSLFS